MRSIIPYIGGKSRLADEIIKHFPTDHQCYVEVFAGAANFLFRKDPVHTEVINDINKDLITLYRVVKNHFEEFYKQLKWLLVSRDEYNRFLETPGDVLTDIQRAVRYYYLAKTSFGGKQAGQSFGYAPSSPPRFNLLRIEEDLSEAHLRLARVYIENIHYLEILKRYDRPYTVFYLDPPYDGCEDDYGKGVFSKDDFGIMAAVLSTLTGRFILSLNDTKLVRDIYRKFNIVPVETVYSLGKGNKTKVKEVLIKNF
ncbi:MAG: DNA adenine methylase [Deferribacterales bacterium]